MSATLAANEVRRQLRYNFTDPERIDKAKALAESLNRYSATEAELSRIKSDYKSRLEAIQAEVDLLNGAVLSGYELREYVCFYSYDDPKPGRKTLRKREGLEVVGEEDMTERDRQMVMDILDAEAAKAEEQKLERPALPAPKEWPDDPADFAVLDAVGDDNEWVVGWVRALFIDADFSHIHSREEVSARFEKALPGITQDEIAAAVCFIANHKLTQQAGWSWLYHRLLDASEATRAKNAAAKKASRKGRNAGSSGTVEVASDEGSRDDAGPDSKDKL